jgi:acetyltransferase-like isoleucine patch superfamily enzyme
MKRILNAVATLLVLPLIAMYRTTLLITRRDAVLQGYSQLLSLLPGQSGNYVRRAFYRRVLRRCSPTCTISFGTIFATPDAEIGEHVYIGARCMIGHATIQDDVLIGSNVDILSGRNQHHAARLDIPIRLQGGTFERVTIGRDSWIGNGACVAAHVGEQAIVAAGAVIVKPVEPRSVVGGNPARVLSHRTGAEPEGRPLT